MRRLSVRQLAILVGIDSYTEKHGFPPSMRELTEMVGLASVTTLHGHLHRLKERGLVQWEPTKPRTLRRVKEPVTV
jgi:SOS-response transcriptional repressor LexA